MTERHHEISMFKDGYAGFTMIEIIVSLAILSTSVLAVFGVIRTCSAACYHSRKLTESVLFAERLFAETRLSDKLAFEKKNGQEEDFFWQIQIAPTPDENVAAVNVQVTWFEQQRKQQYDLYSLICFKANIEGK